MEQHGQSWEDLRLVLAIARGGGLSGAARLLGLHHATVLRRLNAFEYRMGVLLFERRATGYQPTETGEELARIAGAIDEEVASAYRKLAGQDLRLAGTVRLATSDFLGQTLLPKVLRAFHRRYPSIEVETVISPQFASLTRRDADVAFRAASDIPDNLVGKRLARIRYGVYAHGDLQGGAEQLDWVGDDHTISHVTTNKWRRDNFPNARIRMRFDSLIGKYTAIRSGIGIGFLPHFMGIADPDLRCVASGADDWWLDLWLLSHPDLSRMNRISAFLNTVEDEVRKLDLDAIDEHSHPLSL